MENHQNGAKSSRTLTWQRFTRFVKFNFEIPYILPNFALMNNHCQSVIQIWNLQKLGDKGPKGFYEGEIATAIVEAVNHNGGVMSLEDLKSHTSTRVDPISVEYKGVRLWEIPPNGQGIVALMTLNILKGFDMKGEFYFLQSTAFRTYTRHRQFHMKNVNNASKTIMKYTSTCR